MVISGYFINCYQWLAILLMAIGGYDINDYCGYSINGYSWLFW
jgi:hypothetical protein